MLSQILAIFLIILLSLGFMQPSQAQTRLNNISNSPPNSKPIEYPQICTIGTYVSSLYELNLPDRSFGADLMLWSNCTVPNVEPLSSINFLNAKNLETNINSEQKRGKSYWTLMKVRGTFRFPWQLENYPFDRHVLNIALEDKIRDVTLFSFQKDVEKSSCSPDINLKGWDVSQCKLDINNLLYTTTFGDPELAGTGRSVYSRVNISLALNRSSTISFFKLTTPVYVALAIAAISFFLSPMEPPLMSGRMAILVGALFSVVLNMRSAESLLGRVDGLTLVDKVHLNTMIYIFIAALIAVITRSMYKSRGEKYGKYTDRITLPIFVLSYIAINFMLVESAKSIG